MTKELTKEERDKLFPYETFPIRFVYPLGNGKEQVVAHFQCQDHVDKYIVRHNMKKGEYEISYRDESLRPPEPKPKRTRKSRPKPTATEASITEPEKKKTNGRSVRKDNEKPTTSRKTNKTNVESKSPKKRTRSTSSVRGRKSSVDSTRNTTRNRKKV